MNVPVTCRGGLHPPSHKLQLSIEHDWHSVEGRMQSVPTKLVCSLLEIFAYITRLRSGRKLLAPRR
jgi:hypothetical protein